LSDYTIDSTLLLKTADVKPTKWAKVKAAIEGVVASITITFGRKK
jgi:hypothetical protein